MCQNQPSDPKDARIKELEEEVATLKQQLQAARSQRLALIEQVQNQARRNYRDEYDYLPYGEDDRDR